MYKQGKAEAEEIQHARGHYSSELEWYCVITHGGQEKKIGDAILKSFASINEAEILIPALRSDAPTPGGSRLEDQILFRGYLFLRCRMNDEIYMTICANKGVKSIHGRAYRAPLALDPQEMEALKQLLDCVPGPRVGSWPGSNAQVFITGGMLKGLEGRIFEDHAETPKVAFQLSFMGLERSVIVALPRAQLQYAKTSAGTSTV